MELYLSFKFYNIDWSRILVFRNRPRSHTRRNSRLGTDQQSLLLTTTWVCWRCAAQSFWSNNGLLLKRWALNQLLQQWVRPKERIRCLTRSIAELKALPRHQLFGANGIWGSLKILTTVVDIVQMLRGLPSLGGLVETRLVVKNFDLRAAFLA